MRRHRGALSILRGMADPWIVLGDQGTEADNKYFSWVEPQGDRSPYRMTGSPRLLGVRWCGHSCRPTEACVGFYGATDAASFPQLQTGLGQKEGLWASAPRRTCKQ